MHILKKYSLSIQYIIAIFFGILSGSLGSKSIIGFAYIISEIFIRIFKCLSLPIIILSVIVTFSKYQDCVKFNSIIRSTLFYTITTTWIAALMSFFLYLAIHPITIDLHNLPLANYTKPLNYFSHISTLIPDNLITPFIHQQVISVLFFGILIGIAIRYIHNNEARHTVTLFFNGLHALFMVLVQWVVKIIPIGMYGFITISIHQIRDHSTLAGIGSYLLVIILANLIQGFIVLPVWLKSNNMQPFNMMKGMFPALSLAFFSKSSVGALPVTIDVAEKNLNIPSLSSRLLFPVCTSINMNGCAAFIFVTVIYILENNGIHLSLFSMFLWTIIATIAAIGNAGVPMGCFFLSASLLSSMNIPINIMGIILPFYGLIDMLETSLNVWSDVCVVSTVSNLHKQ